MNQFSPPLVYLNLETWVRSLGQGRPHGEGTSNPLQYSCLANHHRGAWWAIVHGVTRSQTQLSDHTFFLSSDSSLHTVFLNMDLYYNKCFLGCMGECEMVIYVEFGKLMGSTF